MPVWLLKMFGKNPDDAGRAAVRAAETLGKLSGRGAARIRKDPLRGMGGEGVAKFREGALGGQIPSHPAGGTPVADELLRRAAADRPSPRSGRAFREQAEAGPANVAMDLDELEEAVQMAGGAAGSPARGPPAPA